MWEKIHAAMTGFSTSSGFCSFKMFMSLFESTEFGSPMPPSMMQKLPSASRMMKPMPSEATTVSPFMPVRSVSYFSSYGSSSGQSVLRSSQMTRVVPVRSNQEQFTVVTSFTQVAKRLFSIMCSS